MGVRKREVPSALRPQYTPALRADAASERARLLPPPPTSPPPNPVKSWGCSNHFFEFAVVHLAGAEMWNFLEEFDFPRHGQVREAPGLYGRANFLELQSRLVGHRNQGFAFRFIRPADDRDLAA